MIEINKYTTHAISEDLLSLHNVDQAGDVVKAEVWVELWKLVFHTLNDHDEKFAYVYNKLAELASELGRYDTRLKRVEDLYDSLNTQWLDLNVTWTQLQNSYNIIAGRQDDIDQRYQALNDSFIHYGKTAPDNEHIKLWVLPTNFPLAPRSVNMLRDELLDVIGRDSAASVENITNSFAHHVGAYNNNGTIVSSRTGGIYTNKRRVAVDETFSVSGECNKSYPLIVAFNGTTLVECVPNNLTNEATVYTTVEYTVPPGVDHIAFTTAGTSKGAFNISKIHNLFKPVSETIAEKVDGVVEALGGVIRLTKDDFINGSYMPNADIDYSLITHSEIPVHVGDRIIVKPTDAFRVWTRICNTPSAQHNLESFGWIPAGGYLEYISKFDGYLILQVSKADGTQITKGDYGCVIIVDNSRLNTLSHEVEDLHTCIPHYNKNIVFFGDSIIGKYRDTNDTTDYSIPKMVADKTHSTCYNAGFGGCTMVSRNNYWGAFSMCALADSVLSGDWSVQESALVDGGTSLPAYFAETVSMLKNIEWTDVDMVCIAYGTNDCGTGAPITAADSSYEHARTYFKGALEYSIEKIIEKNPNIEIVVITPMWKCVFENGAYLYSSDDAQSKNTVGYKMTDYVDACIDVANRYHVACVDRYYALGINQYNYSNYFDGTDGTHPNTNGRLLCADAIIYQTLSKRRNFFTTKFKTINGESLEGEGDIVIKDVPKFSLKHKPFTNIINDCQTLSDWTSPSDGVLEVDAANFILGKQSLHCNKQMRCTKHTYDLLNNDIVLKLRINSIAQGASLELRAGGGDGTSLFVYEITRGTTWTVSKDWQEIAIPHTAYRYDNAAADFKNINNIYIAASGGAVDWNLQYIGLRPKRLTKGIVTFTFDDGYKSQYTGIKLLAEKGITGTIFHITPANDNGLNVSELQELVNYYGADIEVHGNPAFITDTVPEAERNGFSAAWTEESLKAYWDEQRNYLKENGLSEGKHMAYPNGQFPDRVVQMARTYFESCRTIIPFIPLETYPPADKYRLRAVSGVGAYNVTVDKVKSYIDRANETGAWLILVFHKIGDGPDSMWCSEADLEAIADYAISSGAHIMNYAEVMDSCF
jgi:lysophospholipase L1-like esterase/peptidoglycan/xylan/chitin deacetylase (PgdA/CDA1 family)